MFYNGFSFFLFLNHVYKKKRCSSLTHNTFLMTKLTMAWRLNKPVTMHGYYETASEAATALDFHVPQVNCASRHFTHGLWSAKYLETVGWANCAWHGIILNSADNALLWGCSCRDFTARAQLRVGLTPLCPVVLASVSWWQSKNPMREINFTFELKEKQIV